MGIIVSNRFFLREKLLKQPLSVAFPGCAVLVVGVEEMPPGVLNITLLKRRPLMLRGLLLSSQKHVPYVHSRSIPFPGVSRK